jgi:hypothetical protein
MAQTQPFPPVQLPTPRVQPQPNFPNQIPPRLFQLERAEEMARSRVVCGMTVIPANPRIDRKFVIPQPPTFATPQSPVPIKPMIRTVPPAICR